MTAPALGVTLPFDDVPLLDHRPLLRGLIEGGFREVWTGEVAGGDGFSPLALWAGWEPEIGVTCAAASVFTRGPAILAMTAAALGEIAPGRCRFGIGAGSAVIAQSWNGVPFERPYQKVADSLAFLRQVLAGGRADDFETVHAGGFKLSRPVATPPKLVVAALGPRMQRLAAAEADGMVLNFLSASDVGMIRRRCAAVPRNVDGDLEVSARIFVIPGDRQAAEIAARRFLAGYLTVGVYAKFQDWLGRGPELTAMQRAWAEGDRARATRLIDEQTVRDLVVYGSASECAASVEAYFDNGLDAATLHLLPSPDPLPAATRVEFLNRLAAGLSRK